MFNPNKWQPIIGHIARTAPSLQPLVPPRHTPFVVTRVHNPGLHTQGNSPLQGGPRQGGARQGGARQGPTPIQNALQKYGHPRNTDPSPSTGTPQKNISKRVDSLPTPEQKQEYRLNYYGRSNGFQQGHRPSPSTRSPLNPPPYNGAQRGDSRMSGPSVTPPSSQRRPMPIVNQSGLYPTPRQSAPVYPCTPFQPSPATRPHIRAEGAPPQRDTSRTPPPASRSQKPSFGASSQRRPIPIVNQRVLSPTPRQTAPVYPSSPFQPSPAIRPHIRAEPPPPQRNESRSSAPLIFPEPTSRSQRPTVHPFSLPVLPHLKEEKMDMLNPTPNTSVTIECESNLYERPHLTKR